MVSKDNKNWWRLWAAKFICPIHGRCTPEMVSTKKTCMVVSTRNGHVCDEGLIRGKVMKIFEITYFLDSAEYYNTEIMVTTMATSTVLGLIAILAKRLQS